MFPNSHRRNAQVSTSGSAFTAGGRAAHASSIITCALEPDLSHPTTPRERGGGETAGGVVSPVVEVPAALALRYYCCTHARVARSTKKLECGSEVGVRVAVGAVVAHRVGVLFVLHGRALGQGHDGAHRVADLHANAARVGGFVPHGEDVLLVANREHAAADLVAHAELTAEDGQ